MAKKEEVEREEGLPFPPPLPPDDERCRRRGTPNWRCPQRAIPGKSHCLKHYLSYVSRRLRHRRKPNCGVSSETISAAPGDSSIEPYRPVIDFELHQPQPVHQAGFSGDWAEAIMGRFDEVEFWNGEIALGEGGAWGRGNDDHALDGGCGGDGGSENLLEGGVDFDGFAIEKRKRGRPQGPKNKKNKIDHDQDHGDQSVHHDRDHYGIEDCDLVS